jgi:predicted nuclease with TOPRIM domain
MNPEGFAVFIPIVALCIPVAAIVVNGLQKLARLRIEEAKVKAGLLDGQSATELSALREEMGDVRRELSEVQERLDFAERLLTSGRAPGDKA